MHIRWTQPAARDLTNICDYTENHNGSEAARKVAIRIYEAVASLKQFPHMGRPGRKPGTRELVLPDLPFLAIYRVGEEVIVVARILHGAQQWP